MSRLEIPVVGKTMFTTGDVRLKTEISLSLKDNAGSWWLRVFLVDSGTEVTTFPAYEAKRLDLPLPIRASVGASHAQTGLEIRSGYLRFRIDGMDPTEYVIGCLFLGDPDVLPDPNQLATFPRNLLQPYGLLDQLRFIAEKDPAQGLPYGHLVVEKR